MSQRGTLAYRVGPSPWSLNTGPLCSPASEGVHLKDGGLVSMGGAKPEARALWE